MEGKQAMQTESEPTTVSKSYSGLKKEKMEGPDCGKAWIVAMACCMINFIMAGLGRMSGILFVAFIEVYGVDRKTASMPFSVRSSAGNLFGPVVGILGQKYGARKIIIIGGIIGTISSAACFFAPDVMWITVLWGGVNGLGSALTVTLPQVVIGQYFLKHRTTAAGIAFSGGCLGSFVFPMLLEHLLQNYGIEGTFLIIGAIIMHTIPAALILRKPSWLKNKVTGSKVPECPKSSELAKPFDCQSASESKPQKYELDEAKDYLNIDSVSVYSVNECTPKRTPKSAPRLAGIYPNAGLLRQNSELVEKIFAIKTPESVPTDINQNEVNILNELLDMCYVQRTDLSYNKVKKILFADETNVAFKEKPTLELPEVHFSDTKTSIKKQGKLFVQNKLLEIKKLSKEMSFFPEERNLSLILAELCKFKTPEIISKDGLETKQSSKEAKADKHSDSIMDHIKTAFMLYANPLFLMVCLCRAVHFIAFIPAMTTVVDFSIDKGLHEDDGKFAIAAISMGDLLGRLCFGWVTDRGFLTLPKYMMTVMIAQGISTASLPMMHTKLTIFSTLALFGMLQGSLFVRHPVLISKYMKSNEQSIAMGCVNFISGIIGFGLPLYIGYFRDTMGSYDYIFYLNGMLGACVGLLWVFEPFFIRCVNKKLNQKMTTV